MYKVLEGNLVIVLNFGGHFTTLPVTRIYNSEGLENGWEINWKEYGIDT
jgi:hypothetical protein